MFLVDEVKIMLYRKVPTGKYERNYKIIQLVFCNLNKISDLISNHQRTSH